MHISQYSCSWSKVKLSKDRAQTEVMFQEINKVNKKSPSRNIHFVQTKTTSASWIHNQLATIKLELENTVKSRVCGLKFWFEGIMGHVIRGENCMNWVKMRGSKLSKLV